MKAFLKNYRQSPRKVRSVANLVRGKSVAEARTTLKFLAKRAGSPLEKLIQSAAANAVKMGREEGSLFIKELRVDKGIVMKRMMPAAMGAAHRINKRTSHITLVLGEKETGNKVEKPKKSAVKKEKKPAAKAAVK
jgi:large subunit ribosomal protein L22